MGKYDGVQIEGLESDRILADIEKQMAEWGMTLPPVECMPFDFGLGRFMDVGETEFWLANDAELGYCGKFLFLFENQTCPYHFHKMKHETFHILKGTVRMTMGEEIIMMPQGSLLAMPPGASHTFTAVDGAALVLEVSMPSILNDNFFSDKAIGTNGVI
ncbi:MAG: cupin domain-containing protein [Armatimonadota bacterium]